MTQSSKRIKFAIYAMGLIAMGNIGVAGALAVLSGHFADYSQNMVQNLVSIPCIVVIPVSLIAGKLMDVFSKKTLGIIGSLLFLIGGFLPYFMNSLPAILVMRGVMGAGVGLIQSVANACVSTYFEGAEREKTQGNLQSAQMLGAIVLLFSGGWLAGKQWNLVFLVHLLSIIPIICVLAMLPNDKPQKAAKSSAEAGSKAKLNAASFGWAFVMFVGFLSIQVYSVFLSYLMADKGFPASLGGLGVSMFAWGGFVSGLFFGKYVAVTKQFSLPISFVLFGLMNIAIAFSPNVVLMFIAALIFGMMLSFIMSDLVVKSATCVSPAASAMSISLAMCLQNFGQFLCPYIVNPLMAAVAPSNINFGAFIFAGILAIALGIIVIVPCTKSAKQTA